MTTTEEFLQRARELRREADDAEDRFLAYLYDGEQQPEIWRASGMTYPEFLSSSNICKAETLLRYKRYRATRDGLGQEAIGGVGINAVIAAGTLKTKEQQREVLDRARKWELTNDTSISEQSAQRLASEAKILDLGRHRTKGYAELCAENERLRAKVAVLEQEKLALATELRALKKAGPKKAGGKSSKKAA